MLKAKYKLVDLFCGCGGISRGFEWTGRFGTQLGVELMPYPAAAFAQNIRNADGLPARTLVMDIEELAADPARLWSELRVAGITEAGELDVLTGGPPCQGFSRNGVRQYHADERAQRFYDDPRNHLYKAFLSIVEQTSPKILLIENVREFLNFNGGKFSTDLMMRLNELGYDVAFKKVCAADFGVPQLRWRVFFVAVRKDVADQTGAGPQFPKQRFAGAANQSSLLCTKQPYITVKDAIGDLPSPAMSKKCGALPYDEGGIVSEYGLRMRNPKGVVTTHFSRQLSHNQIARINAVGSGRMKHIAPELQTGKFYGSAYRRLSWDEPALTITTWVYHVGSGRFAHPSEDRGVTMREAARLQSFDDSFVFPNLVNPTSQMIGNAVPPMVAYRFAGLFAGLLDAFGEARARAANRSVA